MARFAAFAAGVGLTLEPFQRLIARHALTGPPETLSLLPRGNGKTTLLAALAVHHLLTTPDPAVYVAAASRDQARILYEAARRFVEHTPDTGLVLRHLEIRAPGGHLRVLAADAPKVHGLTPSLAIIDELHAHRDGELYVALRTAMHKRPGSRLVSISTAGEGPDTPLGRLRARGLAQPHVTRDGALTTATGENLALLEWAVPEDGDTTDDAQVKAANPASWITPKAIRGQREALPPLAFERYHANRWVGAEGAWLPPGAWQACIGTPTFTPREPIWVGVDIGGEQSATAVAWVNEHHHVGVWIGYGDTGVLDAIDTIEHLAATYNIREVAFDPWRFQQAAQELHARGIPVVEFPQTDVRMMPASDRLRRAITSKQLTLPDDDELRAHSGMTIARHTRRGWRLDKARATDHIDAVVALCMAVDRLENQPEPTRVLAAW